MNTQFYASLPQFNLIDLKQIEAKLKQHIANHKNKLTNLLKQSHFTWKNLLEPLEDMNNQLDQFWSPIQHLHGVKESELLRKVFHKCLPLLTDYHTFLLQNERLYGALESIVHGQTYAQLNKAQQKIIENEIRDFKLLGVHLPLEKKQRMAELQKELSNATTIFSDHVLDATGNWKLPLTSIEDTAGLPPQALKAAEETAKTQNLPGWLITLEYPSYSAAIKYLNNRTLRKKIYEAYVTRASDQGPDTGKWDNTPIIDKILSLRHEIATLVGYQNYADYSLATKMAKSSNEVLVFLNDLLMRSRPFAEKEINELRNFAKKTDGIEILEPWDTAYYSEKLQAAKFHFTQEELRPYFPLARVLSGLFQLVKQLFGLEIKEEKNIDIWNPLVQFFSIYDKEKELRGGLYIDLYARTHKRDGAWMDDCINRRRLPNGQIQYPVAFLTCNFMRPLENQPALLTHDDVLTLFHEFGHCLHHLLTKVDYASISGLNGVPWDAVEFPSQFMELWCWDKRVLNSLSEHYQTHKPLPETLFQQLLKTKHFQAGLQMLRQLEFALFDFRLHAEYHSDYPRSPLDLLSEIRQKTSFLPTPDFYRFPQSFSHIFGGGYAAGYYSYKWAEVLSCDAFSLFEEKGLFQADTGHAFLHHILEVGGVPEPIEAFKAFRGRAPKIDALLTQSGLS